MELDPVDEGVLVDRPRVRGALAQGLAVGLAGEADVRLGGRRIMHKLDRVDLDQTGTDPVAAALLDLWPLPQPDRHRDIAGQDVIAQLAAELHIPDASSPAKATSGAPRSLRGTRPIEQVRRGRSSGRASTEGPQLRGRGQAGSSTERESVRVSAPYPATRPTITASAAYVIRSPWKKDATRSVLHAPDGRLAVTRTAMRVPTTAVPTLVPTSCAVSLSAVPIEVRFSAIASTSATAQIVITVRRPTVRTTMLTAIAT